MCDKDYKCSVCGTWTVSCSLDWGRPGNSYDEILYDIFTCNKCGAECSYPSNNKEYKEGDTIYF